MRLVLAWVMAAACLLPFSGFAQDNAAAAGAAQGNVEPVRDCTVLGIRPTTPKPL